MPGQQAARKAIRYGIRHESFLPKMKRQYRFRFVSSYRIRSANLNKHFALRYPVNTFAQARGTTRHKRFHAGSCYQTKLHWSMHEGESRIDCCQQFLAAGSSPIAVLKIGRKKNRTPMNRPDSRGPQFWCRYISRPPAPVGAMRNCAMPVTLSSNFYGSMTTTSCFAEHSSIKLATTFCHPAIGTTAI